MTDTPAPTDAQTRIGAWLSAALDDPNVCAEMKADINAWFAETHITTPQEPPHAD